MAGFDNGNTLWASQFAELAASQAAEFVELLGRISAEPADGEWVRLAERLEAQWHNFLQEQTEAIVEAWPDFVRNLTSVLPELSRGQPLFVILAQLLPLLAGPEVLGRAIESKGGSLVKMLEDFLPDLCRSLDTDANSVSTADT